MSVNGNIEVSNLPELVQALEKVSGSISESVYLGMQRTGLNIINDAKRNLTVGRINNTGFLRASGRVEKNATDKTIEVGFFGTGINQGYAYYVENGRRSGKFPPLWNIRAWAYKKLRISEDKGLNSAAFLIARKIAKKGTKARKFFQPAVDRRLYDLEREVRNMIKNVIG